MVALLDLVKEIESLRAILESFVTYQNDINTALLTHTHLSPFFGVSTSPAVDSMADIVKATIQLMSETKVSLEMHRVNFASWGTNYCSPVFKSYINSGYNTTN